MTKAASNCLIIDIVGQHEKVCASNRGDSADDSMIRAVTPLHDWPTITESLRPDLIGLARRKFRLSDEESRELVQEVVAAWLVRANCSENQLGCRSREHLFAILCQNLTRRWIDGMRKASRNEPLEDETAISDSVEDILMLLQRKELIHQEFVRLPARRQVALHAIYIEGATQDAVAARLNIDRRLVSEWKRTFEAALNKRAREVGLHD